VEARLEVTRLTLKDIPPHLLGLDAPPTPNEERTARVAELRALRARLSRCAGRMAPTQGSILSEVEAVEAVLVELRRLAERL